MKVLSTKVDGEVQHKFQEKIEAEGLDTSDVLRRLVNAYVGESKDVLSSAVDLVEVDGRITDIDDRLQRIGSEVDDKIKEKIDGKCQTLSECIDALRERVEDTEDARNQLTDILTEVDVKIKLLSKQIQNVGNVVIEIDRRAKWTDDDVKDFKRTGELLPFTLENVREKRE